MKRNFNQFLVLIFMGLMLVSSAAIAQTTIRGNVTDDAGEALIGANVVVKGSTSDGDITDENGNYTITTSQALPLTLVFSYTGFGSQEIDVTSDAPLNVILVEGILSDEIIISASRKAEKVQDAPASISVVGARQLETSANTDATRNLINTPGVSITQQSAGRINIEMRAGVGQFGTSAFPIMDYRSLVGPGIGTFQSDASGINNIDLARIEVVRGPGSALYGPGVTSGVIHFITKNPIDFPGTTVQASYGNLNTLNAAVRHAGRNDSKTFGYKVTASYNRGDEFTLDGSEGTTDAAGVFTRQIDKFSSTIVQPNTKLGYIDSSQPGEELLTLTPREDGNVMQDFYENMSFGGHLEFRPQDDLSVTVSGGFNAASTVFYNDLGEGLAQSTEIWTQARMQKGGLFAQIFYVNNDGGSDSKPTYLYQTGNNAGIARQQLEGQVQYNFQTPKLLNADWTVGLDYRQAITDTGNRTYGSQEDEDDYTIFGGYAQGKFELAKKLDMIIAGRYDSFSFLDEGFFSPRLAFVYKPTPAHTFRATFNRAGGPPSGLQMAVDFPVNVPVAGAFDIWLAGMNRLHEFGENPNIEFLNQNIVAGGIYNTLDPDGLNPALLQTLIDLGTALPDELPAGQLGVNGLSNAFVHGVATGSILGQVAGTPLEAPIAAYLGAIMPEGNLGTFFGVNLFETDENGLNRPLNDLIDTNTPQLSTSNTYELGYKGLINNKLGVMVDVYHVQRKGFSDFTAIAPLVSLVGQDLTTLEGVAADFFGFLTGIGVDVPTATALSEGYGTVATLVPNYYGTGTVETSLMPQGDGIMHVAAGYRIFEDAEVSYTGVDVGLEYYITDDLSAWGNYSYISQNEFDGEDLGEGADSPLTTAFNTPKNKFRLGLTLTPQTGFRGSVSFQHDDSFLANTGQFGGPTDVKNLVDMSVGYKLDNGLSIDVSGNNIFNTKYRAFPNMPEIGAMYRLKLTYTFGEK